MKNKMSLCQNKMGEINESGNVLKNGSRNNEDINNDFVYVIYMHECIIWAGKDIDKGIEIAKITHPTESFAIKRMKREDIKNIIGYI